jgi:hypothetical protein
MKFDYKRYRTVAGTIIERPVIPILIRNPRTQRSVGYAALIDSGADHCIFSSEIADIIGIDLATGERDDISGVVAGARRPIYFHDVEISVGGNVHAIRAAFMPELSLNGHGLLGQYGLFDRFSFVKFEQAKVFVVEDREEEGEGNDAFWTRIGSAWPHKDGKGLNLVLSALPINGRLVLRVVHSGG